MRERVGNFGQMGWNLSARFLSLDRQLFESFLALQNAMLSPF